MFAVATSAARDARNSDQLITRLHEAGVGLQVIPGWREAELSFAGAASAFGDEPLVVVDVGGGSTEFTAGGAGAPRLTSHSYNVGCRRVTERFLHSDPPSQGEIAEALAHAHANGLVHCDIKPHNILMMNGQTAKVADFGIARAVTESTMTYSGNVIGSVHYFSPEQAKGTMITPKSDVYSLGVVLYEMLTGELPFTGENPVSIAMKHLQDEPTPVRRIDPDIPPVVEALVSRMMAKDPAMRPSSEEVVHEVEQAKAMMNGSAPAAAPDPYATQVLPRVGAAAPGGIPSRRAQQSAYQPQGYEPQGYEPEQEKTSFFRSKKFIFGLVLVLILGFGVGAFLSFGKFWSTNEVVVPDVVGKQMTLARQILEDKKLRVNVAETYSADVPPGQVVSQTPEAGSKVKEERLVTIYVSKGGEELTMPDLQGLSKSEAEAKLQKMGLKLGTVYEKNSDEEAGTVISQDPKAGSKISKGQEVDIIVSKGPKTKKVSVPTERDGRDA